MVFFFFWSPLVALNTDDCSGRHQTAIFDKTALKLNDAGDKSGSLRRKKLGCRYSNNAANGAC